MLGKHKSAALTTKQLVQQERTGQDSKKGECLGSFANGALANLKYISPAVERVPYKLVTEWEAFSPVRITGAPLQVDPLGTVPQDAFTIPFTAQYPCAGSWGKGLYPFWALSLAKRGDANV